MKKTLVFVLAFLAVCLSITVFAQADSVGVVVPDPVKFGDWKRFLDSFLSVETIGAIAVFVTTEVTMGLTNRFKNWFQTNGKYTIYINVAVNAVVTGLLFLLVGKLGTAYEVAAYVITTVITALRDKGKYDTLVRTSAKATEPRLG